MLYDEARMALTKERLEDLRKEKKLSFEQLSKQLAERGTVISHTNLKNYEINDSLHSLYNRTRSMSIEYLIAFADFYDVSIEYLLGFSNSRKREYHDISEQLGLCDGAIAELIRCKEHSGSENVPKIYAEKDTVILDDFLTNTSFEYGMEKIKQSIFAYYMYELSKGSSTEEKRERDAEKIEEARQTMNTYGYFPVENNVISAVQMESAIGELTSYLRQLPKRLYEEHVIQRENKPPMFTRHGNDFRVKNP